MAYLVVLWVVSVVCVAGIVYQVCYRELWGNHRYAKCLRSIRERERAIHTIDHEVGEEGKRGDE